MSVVQYVDLRLVGLCPGVVTLPKGRSWASCYGVGHRDELWGEWRTRGSFGGIVRGSSKGQITGA